MPTHVSVLPLLLLPFLLTAAFAQNCGQGEFRSGSSCKPCPKGTYQNLGNQTSCNECPKGTYNPFLGARGIDICIECPPNTFGGTTSATSRAQCLPCPPNQFSPQGAPQCLRCEPGQQAVPEFEFPSFSDLFITFFRATRFVCFDGEFPISCGIDAPIEYTCAACPFNTFTDKPNAAESCTPCPKGTFAAPGSPKCLPQKTCSPGFARPQLGQCEECFGSRISDGTFPKCRTCPPGFNGNKEFRATKCTPCPAGTARRAKEFRCEPCEPGENSFVTGAEFCYPDNTPCAPNFFRNSRGVCKQCAVNQRFDPDTKRCIACPKNSLSKGALSTTCTPCPSGSQASKGQGRCICKLGFEFMAGRGATSGSCRKCRPGTVRGRNNGRTRSSGRAFLCQECPQDTFAPRAGMKACLPCPEGSRQPRSGQRKCVRDPPCRNGLVPSDEYGCVDPSTNCPPNFGRIQVTQVQPPHCNPRSCPDGLALIKEVGGQALISAGFGDEKSPCEFCNCGACKKGERYDAVNFFCTNCDREQTSAGGLVRVCRKCPKGMVGAIGRCACIDRREMRNGKCMPCPTGTFGFDDRPGCEPCPPGTFSNREEAKRCRKCKRGTFSSEAGSSSCQPCPSGTTTFGIGESGCVRRGSLKT